MLLQHNKPTLQLCLRWSFILTLYLIPFAEYNSHSHHCRCITHRITLLLQHGEKSEMRYALKARSRVRLVMCAVQLGGGWPLGEGEKVLGGPRCKNPGIFLELINEALPNCIWYVFLKCLPLGPPRGQPSFMMSSGGPGSFAKTGPLHGLHMGLCRTDWLGRLSLDCYAWCYGEGAAQGHC